MQNLKKNLREKYEEDITRPIFFFDESRFGTHSKLGHGWFTKGSRTPVNTKLGFQNFYLYSAVDIKSGEDFTLILPKVNTICMNLFLTEMMKYIQNKSIIIVMDGAGWHHAKDLQIPSNIEIVYLPAYSPELNPVERLWLHIKQSIIKNKVYETINDLEDAVCEFFNGMLDAQTIKSICNVSYL